MKLSEYFKGQKVIARSSLSPGEVKARINEATPLVPWPWTVGISGRVVGRSVRMNYRTGLIDYNAKPVLAGRLHDDLGATRLEAKFRAPAFAYLFFPFWYFVLLMMGSVMLMSAPSDHSEPEAWIFFPMLCLFAIAPIVMHYLFNRNSADQLEEILLFLGNTADFNIIEAPHSV